MLNTKEGMTNRNTRENVRKTTKEKGFTLVELIVVVAILAILAGIAIFRFMGFQEKARQSVCRTNRQQLVRLTLLDEVNDTPAADSESEINAAIDPEFSPGLFEGICPSDGVINLVNGVYLCSIHPDEEISITDEDGDETESTPGAPEESEVPDEPGEPEDPGDPVPYL